MERFVREIEYSKRATPVPLETVVGTRRPVAALEDAADREVRTFKTLAAVFGLATLSLIGVIIYLLTK
ncbi:MAG: hypothetical protein ACI9OJ_005161 [Myxococcota bacterium]